jgi:thioredoxin-related protein
MKYKYLILFIFSLTAFLRTEANKKVGINWMTIAEVEEKMKTEPKKILVDVFTGWCHWCKVMDKKTYRNTDVINYLNENYYCIKFNAEQKQEIEFGGVVYYKSSGRRTHDLASDWLNGQISYPTTVFFNNQFQEAKQVPGYLNVEEMLLIASYFQEEKEKVMSFAAYKSMKNQKK